MDKKSLPDILIGERIVLKKLTEEMAPILFKAIDKDRERLRKFLPWPDFVLTIEDELNYIKKTLEEWEEATRFDYGIFDRQKSEFVGNLGVHSILWRFNRCELGYWIASESEGKGLISEGIRILEKALFEAGFHRIEIRCNTDNQKSANVPSANGYLLEGIFREDVLEYGKYRDTLIFGKLATDVSKEKNAQISPIENETLSKSQKPIEIKSVDHLRFSVLNPKICAKWWQKVTNAKVDLEIENYIEIRSEHLTLAFAKADKKSPWFHGNLVPYIRVNAFNLGVDFFKLNGAKLYRGPLEIENNQCICQMKDPFGNVFGLIGML